MFNVIVHDFRAFVVGAPDCVCSLICFSLHREFYEKRRANTGYFSFYLLKKRNLIELSVIVVPEFKIFGIFFFPQVDIDGCSLNKVVNTVPVSPGSGCFQELQETGDRFLGRIIREDECFPVGTAGNEGIVSDIDKMNPGVVG